MLEDSFFSLATIILTLAALFGYLNHKFLKLPPTIGVVLIAFVASISAMVIDAILPQFGLADTARATFINVDIHDVLMEGAISFLLFAGALHVDFDMLLKRRYAILSLATLGVIVSTTLIGGGIFLVGQWIGLNIPLPFALVFGALISPTDPVAVMGLLKSMDHVPDSLRVKIAGESLFNDGVGIVLFTVLLSMALGSTINSGETISLLSIIKFFAQETIGGILLGLFTGFLALQAIKSIDDYSLEVLITLSLVMLTYGIALQIHVSGPLAVVVAGLIIGNYGARMAMSETTRNYLNTFWLLVDEVLNAGLFLLIGIEVIALTFTTTSILAAIIAIPIVLVARFISVVVPISILGMRRDFTQGAVPVLTWGGMKGAISVALALSIPNIEAREPILVMTYGVVIFSIVVQGLTMKQLVRLVVK